MKQVWVVFFVGVLLLGTACSRQCDLPAKAENGEATGAVAAAAATEVAVAESAKDAPAPGPAQLINIPNAIQPQPGLVVGGQPSEEALEEAAKAGFKTVINLRGVGEMADSSQPAQVEELGMRYISIPVEGTAGLSEANARALDEVLADVAAYPVLLHCGSGNRVGALLALRDHYVEGKSADEALAVGLSSGLTRLEGTVREILGLTPETVH